MHGRHLLAIVLVAAVPLTALAALQGPGNAPAAGLLGAPTPETGDPPTFVVRVFGNQHALEPTLTYRDGKLYYSGMDVEDFQGNLWEAPNDTSDFVQMDDPPPRNGTDAVVHRGEGNFLFYAEQSPVEVSTWDGAAWSAVLKPGLVDRPWFATHGGNTYLAGNNAGGQGMVLQPRVFEYDGGAFVEVAGSPLANGDFGVVDFAIAPNGRLYVLVVDPNTGSGKAFVRSGGAWSETATFDRGLERSFGIPRIAVDAANNVYLAFAAQGPDRPGVWLSRLVGSEWTLPVAVSEDGKTGAMPAIVAGAAGKVGIAWYEADGEAIPADLNATWRVMYAVVAGADGSPIPAPAHRVTAAATVHEGKLLSGSDGVGDFLYAILRDGDAQGKVAIAYARDGPPPPPPPPPPPAACLPFPCPPPPAPPAPPWPGFAYQDAGEGLL